MVHAIMHALPVRVNIILKVCSVLATPLKLFFLNCCIFCFKASTRTPPLYMRSMYRHDYIGDRGRPSTMERYILYIAIYIRSNV